jgi:transposase InsO family protein
VIFHTDQGSEYVAGPFRQAYRRLGITQSMSRPGSGLDNAVIESCTPRWSSSSARWSTSPRIPRRGGGLIENYNHHRSRSARRMMSLVDLEKALAA